MAVINRFYGLFIPEDFGGKTARFTTGDTSDVPSTAQGLLTALLPNTLNADNKKALVEFYIRLIYTDKSMIAMLNTYDPVNTYELHTFYGDFKESLDTASIIKNIKRLGLPGEEVSFTPLDYILNALKQLLTILNG